GFRRRRGVNPHPRAGRIVHSAVTFCRASGFHRMPGREAARGRVRGPRRGIVAGTKDRRLMTRHLIIGGGPAAINAIETIREFDNGSSTITLVSDESAYSRMVLPYYLADRIPRQQVFTGDDAYFDRLK